MPPLKLDHHLHSPPCGDLYNVHPEPKSPDVMGMKRKFRESPNLSPPLARSAFAVAAATRELQAGATANLSTADTPSDSSNVSQDAQADHALHQVQRDPTLLSEPEMGVDVDKPPAPVVSMCSWKPSLNSFYNAPDGVILYLRKRDTVTLVGQYGLEVMSGVVEICGAILERSSTVHLVFAPTIHALPCISCSSDTARIHIRNCPRGIRQLQTLSPLFDQIWNKGNFKEGQLEIGKPHHSFCFMPSSQNDPSKRTMSRLCLTSGQRMIEALCNLRNGRVPTILICGRKSSGKSTLARAIANRLIAQQTSLSPETVSARTVCLLDLDPGQPEWTMPGQISLIQMRKPTFGPSFTHAKSSTTSTARLIRAHALTALSPKVDTIHFIEAANQLMHEYYRFLEQNPGTPLVINCSGWMIGSGTEIVLKFIRDWSPSDIVYSSRTGPGELGPLLQEAAGNNFVHTYNPQSVCEVIGRSPSQLRAMQAMCYFHSDNEDSAGNMQWNTVPVTFRKPWVIRYDEHLPGVFGIMVYGESVAPDCLVTILEGCLVGIVLLEDDTAFSSPWLPRADETNTGNGTGTDSQLSNMDTDMENNFQGRTPLEESPWSRISRTPRENLPYLLTSDNGYTTPLNPWKSFTIGQAIIRGIDVDSQTLQLITPVSDTALEDVLRGVKSGGSKVMLVRGRWDTPDWAYMEERTRAEYKRSMRTKNQKSRNQDGPGGSDGLEEKDKHPEHEAHDQKIPFIQFL